MDQLPYVSSVVAITGGTIVGVTLSGATFLAGSISGSTITVKDANFTIVDDIDTSKSLVFSVGNIATGAQLLISAGAQTGSMTLTVPALTGGDSFVTENAAQTITKLKSFWDTAFAVVGSADTTKRLMVEADTQGAGFTTTLDVGAQTGSRSATLPVMSASDTFATLGVANVFSVNQAVTATKTGGLSLIVTNSGTGTTDFARLSVKADVAANFAIDQFSSGYTGTAWGITLASYAAFSAASTTSNGIIIGHSANKPIIFAISTNEVARFTSGTLTTGGMTLAFTTDSTTATTGALTVPGGVGVAKTLISAKGQGWGVTSTVAVTGTTTLTGVSTIIQTFTGTGTQTITMPAANTWGAAIAVLYAINNQSSATVTPTRAGADTFQGGGTTSAVLAGACSIFASDGVSVWLKLSTG